MPNPLEVCEVEAAGARYRDWTHVQVKREFGGAWASEFVLAVVEPGSGKGGWQGIKLKPGDKVKVKLAGVLVVTGAIDVRQAVIDARSHGIQVQGGSDAIEIVRAAAVIPPGQFKNYTFDAIAKKALQPFGLSLKWKNPPPAAARPFKHVQIYHGETVFELLERLARSRGIFVGDTPDGNLVAGELDKSAAPVAELEEGRNILSARVVINDDAVRSRSTGYAQAPGSDSLWGKDASQIKAEAENPTIKRYRPQIIVSEEPLSKRELQDRVDREQAEQIGTSVRCTVVVQGWLKPGGGGKLWEPGEVVTVKAPSLFPNPSGSQSLAIQALTFAQGPGQEGTTTTLELVLPQALSARFDKGPTGKSPNLFEPGNEAAKPS